MKWTFAALVLTWNRKKYHISYNLKGESTFKIVIPELSTSTSKEAIAAQIEAARFHVLKADQLTKHRSNKKMLFFYFQVQPCKNIDEIYERHDIMGTRVDIESYKELKGPSQCHKRRGSFTVQLCVIFRSSA